ncbi:hypothetical protein ACFOU2_07895 [Bacillus songklensis]|uniref:Uncharacterized protein n=1 Tax=Bacillus songklensis TaxID=1069116 RepID=A0ABV8AZN6_9BACI
MDQDTKVIQELRELNQRVAHLENLIEKTNKEEKVGPVRTFVEAITSLSFGLFVVGPVVVIVVGILMFVWSWIGMKI